MRRFLFFLIVFSSCNRCKDAPALLQAYPVDVTVNINEPAYFDITAVGGWVYFNTGTARVIIYRRSLEEMKVYDVRSTYNVEAGCVVQVESDDVMIKDQCSESKWLIIDGTVAHGPATYSLLQYQSTFNYSTGVLHIYN
jgi:hypothetical protein